MNQPITLKVNGESEKKIKRLAYKEISQTRFLIRGAGEMRSGVAHRLFRSGKFALLRLPFL